MKLCIISHTEHYKNSEGQIVGWGPTINEINHLTEIFDEIYHVSMLHNGEAPKSALPYTSDKITFVPLPALGGKSLAAKAKILINAPQVMRIVAKTLKKVDYFQLRTPTGIGVFLIPYLTLFVKKKGWYKYAGNWNQKNAPIGYAFQRFMLKRQSRTVTINGSWPNQPKHCKTFENPCLTQGELNEGKAVINTKDYSGKLNFCFVGRLEREKGVERIIRAINALDDEEKEVIDTVHFVGEGNEDEFFKQLAKTSGVSMVFHGGLAKQDVFEVYKQSHVFLLPSSASEGFPKVIAEAINYGSIPLVSKISSINQYIKDGENGFIVDPNTVEGIVTTLKKVLSLDTPSKVDLVSSEKNFSHLFSFEAYNKKIYSIVKGN